MRALQPIASYDQSISLYSCIITKVSQEKIISIPEKFKRLATSGMFKWYFIQANMFSQHNSFFKCSISTYNTK